jgi:hypothetical protein
MLFGASAFLFAPGSVTADSHDLSTIEVFSTANFTQQRHLNALTRPLLSSGTVTLTESGFVWSQHQPFETILSFDGVSIIETTSTGTEVVTRTVYDPVTNNLTRTLYQMLTGSWSEIRNTFAIEVEAANGETDWVYRLVPMDEEIRKFIPRIILSGTRYLDRIEVAHDQSNVTLIDLSDQRQIE